MKNHPQIPVNEEEHSSSDCDTIEVNVGIVPEINGAVSSSPVPDIAEQDGPQPHVEFNDSSAIDPALRDYVECPLAPSAPTGLDSLTLLASRQHWGDGTMDTKMAEVSGPRQPQMETTQDWSLNIPDQSHVQHTNINYESLSAPSDANFQGIITSPNNIAEFGFDTNHYSSGGMQDDTLSGMGALARNGSVMPHELQNWFDQFDLESHLQSGTLPAFGTSNSMTAGEDRRGSTLTADGQQSSRSPSSPSALIPNERFAKVERCWPNRRSNSQRLMPTMWWEAVSKPEDNLFSHGSLSPEALEQNRQCGSRWGLDEDCRERLQKMFVNTGPATNKRPSAAFDSPEDFSSPLEGRTAEENESATNDPLIISNFPPAEIFDIGLDLYFRQFHPIMPFIHTPTFCPKTAPTSILSIMCLIGLTILQTKGATAFVRQAFSVRSHISLVLCCSSLAPELQNNH